MEFVELSREEFFPFLMQHELKTFFQSPTMEEMGTLDGWTSYYVGVKENGKIVGASRIMVHYNRLKQGYFYAPRGFLLDYEDKELLTFFTKEIRRFVKKRHGYVLRIDPTLIYQQRDINGDVVEGGIEHKKAVENLISLGYDHHGFTTGMDPVRQVRWVFMMDIEGKSEKDLLKQMKPNTRRVIQRAIHDGVHVRELRAEELPRFKKIMDGTSERRKFEDKTLTYYQNMYRLFHPLGEVKYLIAELDLENYLAILEKDQEELQKVYDKNIVNPRNVNKAKEAEIQIRKNEERIADAKKIMAEEGTCLDLAASMFMTFGDRTMYYHAGSDERFMQFGGQHLIQWHMMQYSIENKKKIYDFYGITGVFNNSDPDYGVYVFKKLFGGYVEEYIGDFDLPINWYYKLNKAVQKVKGIFRK